MDLTMIETSGLECDSCDWKDITIPVAEYPQWIDKACPKCGANVLTQKDHDDFMLVYNLALNPPELTEDKIVELMLMLGLSKEEVIALSKNTDLYNMSFKVHNGVQIQGIKKVE